MDIKINMPKTADTDGVELIPSIVVLGLREVIDRFHNYPIEKIDEKHLTMRGHTLMERAEVVILAKPSGEYAVLKNLVGPREAVTVTIKSSW